MFDRLSRWLEAHWVTPAYGGLLLGALSIFFFAAATNTLAGWLYVISGVIFALLLVGAILPSRSLRGLQISRPPIYPVSMGDALTIEVWLENTSHQPKNLIQATDVLPFRLGTPVKVPIETIAPQETYRWTYAQPTQHRGVYRWQTIELRTASPLGLFWCRRARTVKAKAVVYPIVLPLTQSPLVDEMGKEDNPQLYSQHRAQASTEGLTRALRPYRWGDPIRLIHWRSSARYGELRVRELEVFTGGQEIVIALDSAAAWERGEAEAAIAGIPTDSFEQAVITAASLYFYAVRQNLPVLLWTAGSGTVQGELPVLEALAATYAGEEVLAESLPDLPMIWLTQNSQSLNTLPEGSRWVLWPTAPGIESEGSGGLKLSPGLVIRPDQPLQVQLQASLR